MTTGEVKRITDQVLSNPKLKDVPKFLILGVNRENPGFGDDAVLVNRSTDTRIPIAGEFRRGTRDSRDQQYRAACEEYEEAGWSGEADEGEWEPEEDLYDDPDGEDGDRGEPVSVVTVPEGEKIGKKLEVSYGCDGGSEGERAWKSDTYSFEVIEVPFGLSFHVNKNRDGIKLDEDFFNYPLVCWNTGRLPIKADGKRIPVGMYLILTPDDPMRKARRLHYEFMMSIPGWDSEAKIKRNEEQLLALGCPPEDAHPLAVYFWRTEGDAARDYNPGDHALWMREARVKG